MRISDWSSDVCSSDLTASFSYRKPRFRSKSPASNSKKISIQPVRRIIANLSLRPGLTCSRTWGSTHHSQKNSGAARASELKLHFATSPPSANSGRPPKFRSPPKNPCLPSSHLHRKSVVQGKSESVSLDIGGRRLLKKEKVRNNKNQ